MLRWLRWQSSGFLSGGPGFDSPLWLHMRSRIAMRFIFLYEHRNFLKKTLKYFKSLSLKYLNININLNVVYNFVHLYSFICHLQVVSHGTIAYMNGPKLYICFRTNLPKTALTWRLMSTFTAGTSLRSPSRAASAGLWQVKATHLVKQCSLLTFQPDTGNLLFCLWRRLLFLQVAYETQ